MNLFGQNLLLLVERSGRTQEEIAKLFGFDRTTLRHHISNDTTRNKRTEKHYERFYKLLGIDPQFESIEDIPEVDVCKAVTFGISGKIVITSCVYNHMENE